MSLAHRLRAAQDDTQTALDAALAPFDGPVGAAMRYASEGGKRLRAFLVLETSALFDVPRAGALRAAAAIEAVHAYSLIHDDLPCMDDDDLRRGRPTVHRRWDEATAVLAGDALQTLAFEQLAGHGTDPDPAIRAELVLTLARAAGAAGMVGGQALDIAAETADEPLDIDAITRLQRLKTGRLLEWPCRAGAILGRADPAPLLDYARHLGLAFQIADDLLDVEGDAATLGKATGKDAGAGKATFVSLLGTAEARRRAEALVREAEAALLPFGARAASLKEVARYVVDRDR
ncbi:polyprenyl synthetase family protein [uncultured Jannaschia sp.]|uniref:polyprenyl synthetase family protein n=1 Tax=uncultured Jannaschia sp. TaxID=293347 RepID=UPI00261E010C|nr:farnesyl diphosphate synthase [uncultured Jannaschia sp.]